MYSYTIISGDFWCQIPALHKGMDNRMLILSKTMKHSWHHLFSPMPRPVERTSPTPPAVSSVYIPDPNSANVYVQACHTQITHNKYSTVQTYSACTYLLYTVISLPEHHGQGWKLSLHCASKRLLLPSSESRAMILSAVSASTTGAIRSPDGGFSCVISFTSTASSVSAVSLFFIPAR